MKVERHHAYLALAAVALLAATRKKRKGYSLEAAPERAALPQRPHVGTPDWAWPLQDRFWNERSIQKALIGLGYDVPVDGDFTGEETRRAVAEFGADFNVRARFDDRHAELPVVDEFVYADDMVAIATALDLQSDSGVAWRDLVTEALEDATPKAI